MTQHSSSSAPQVHVERRGAVAVVRFISPTDGTMSLKGAAQMRDHLAALIADDAVRAIVLTGGQKGIFIRHADVGLELRVAQALAEGKVQVAELANNPYLELINVIEAATKPVIAAIDGLCMGGGFEVALVCTMRIASPAATAIGLPEVRINVIPGAGGIRSLTRVVGAHKARLYSLLGSVFSAEEAVQRGIVDELAPNALERALAVAETLATRAPIALRSVLRLSAQDASLEETGLAFAEVLCDPEVLERLRVFVTQGQRLDQVP